MSRAIFNVSLLGAIALSGCMVQLVEPAVTYPHPGPVDAPITESLIYRLRYDPAAKVLTGIRQVADGGEEPITLARVIFESQPGGCASPQPQ